MAAFDSDAAIFVAFSRPVWYTLPMEKRDFYYVTRRNALTWISAVLMLASTVAHIARYCEKGAVRGAEMWFQLMLPGLAGVLFILMILIAGERHLYRTAIPVWMFAISFAYAAWAAVNWRLALLLWLVCASLAGFYTRVTAGKVKHFWTLWFFTAALLAVFLVERRAALLAAAGDFWRTFSLLHGVLLAASVLALSLAIQVRPDGYPYCPTWGDRSDGRRVRTIPAMSYVVPYIMPERAAASNWITDTIDLTPIERYIRAKRLAGLSGFGITHVFLAAYVRIVAQYPAINRFCSGQHVFSRGRDIEFVMAVKTKMTTDAPDTMIKVHFDPADTAEDVYRKLNARIAEVKDAPLDSDFDKTAKILTYIPGLVLKFVVWLLKTMDYFGLIPRFLLGVSPFHGSVILTSMGSLGIPPIVHHLYDFGNLPVFFALGCKYRRNVVEDDGTVVAKKFVDFTVNCDERICDGFYFATGLKYMRKFLAHPERLDEPPEQVLSDID